MLFLDERVEDCSDSHHSRAARVIPATPANESLPSEEDEDTILEFLDLNCVGVIIE